MHSRIRSADSIIQIVKPDSYQFTRQDVGDDDRDSDVDATGEMRISITDSTASFWDAGLILLEKPIATSSPVVTGTPPNWFLPSEPYIGPVRSGRLTYNQIGGMFPNSCLVYASAAYDIGEQLDACEIIFGVDQTTPNSALLTLTRLRQLAKEALNPRQPVNYSGNVFSDTIPEGGQRRHCHRCELPLVLTIRLAIRPDRTGVLAPDRQRRPDGRRYSPPRTG